MKVWVVRWFDPCMGDKDAVFSTEAKACLYIQKQITQAGFFDMTQTNDAYIYGYNEYEYYNPYTKCRDSVVAACYFLDDEEED